MTFIIGQRSELNLGQYDPGDQMASAELKVDGHSYGGIMGHPRALETIRDLVDGGVKKTTTAIAMHLRGEAQLCAAAGMDPVEVAVIERVASYLAGEIETLLPTETVPRVCGHTPDSAQNACGAHNARQCQRCSKWYCVGHWRDPAHACVPQRRPQMVYAEVTS